MMMNYLAKFVEQLFSKTHLDASEKPKNFFCDVTNVEHFDKKCLILSKINQKSKLKSPVKRLRTEKKVYWSAVQEINQR
jgi:hypothetical protein